MSPFSIAPENPPAQALCAFKRDSQGIDNCSCGNPENHNKDANLKPIVCSAEVERLRYLVASTRLDTVFSNADMLRATVSASRTESYHERHYFRRKTLTGTTQTIPLSVVARSWSTPRGRENLKRDLSRKLAKLLEANTENLEQFKLLTLTYRSTPESWRPNLDLRALMNKIRHYARRQGATLSYFWIAEVQTRCALHYHVCLAGLPFIPKRIYRQWWTHGWLDLRAASGEKAARYLTKYVRKSTADTHKSGDLVQRLFQMSRKRHCGSSRNVSARAEKLPAWMDDLEELLEGTTYLEDWLSDTEADILWIKLSDGKELLEPWKPLQWKLILQLEHG